MLTVDPASRARIRKANKLFRKLPADLKKNVRMYQRNETKPIWVDEMYQSVSRNAGSTVQRMVFERNNVKTGAAITLQAGTGNKRLSGGATTGELVRPFEFGTNARDYRTKYYRTSPKGKKHTVTRATRRQLPTRRSGGWVAYPAAKRAVPRITSLTVQTIMRTIYEAAEE